DIATASGTSFNVGNSGGDGPSQPFGGYLDDVSVWGTALTPLQIQALSVGSSSPNYQPGLLPASGSYTATISGTYTLVEDQDFAVFENQAIGGTVSGNPLLANGLNNPSAQPLAGWTVTLRNAQNNVVATTTSQADGRYLFTNVPTGTYTISE